VINISVDLGVYNGKTTEVKAPIEAYVRVIPKAVIRLSSLDLSTTKEISDLTDLFNFGNDYLGLLKAGVIVSGLIPPSFEECQDKVTLQQILEQVIGKVCIYFFIFYFYYYHLFVSVTKYLYLTGFGH